MHVQPMQGSSPEQTLLHTIPNQTRTAVMCRRRSASFLSASTPFRNLVSSSAVNLRQGNRKDMSSLHADTKTMYQRRGDDAVRGLSTSNDFTASCQDAPAEGAVLRLAPGRLRGGQRGAPLQQLLLPHDTALRPGARVYAGIS